MRADFERFFETPYPCTAAQSPSQSQASEIVSNSRPSLGGGSNCAAGMVVAVVAVVLAVVALAVAVVLAVVAVAVVLAVVAVAVVAGTMVASGMVAVVADIMIEREREENQVEKWEAACLYRSIFTNVANLEFFSLGLANIQIANSKHIINKYAKAYKNMQKHGMECRDREGDRAYFSAEELMKIIRPIMEVSCGWNYSQAVHFTVAIPY